jgi:hypothetical protein
LEIQIKELSKYGLLINTLGNTKPEGNTNPVENTIPVGDTNLEGNTNHIGDTNPLRNTNPVGITNSVGNTNQRIEQLQTLHEWISFKVIISQILRSL